MRNARCVLLFLILAISAVFLLHSGASACDNATWQWLNPLPQGLHLYDVWGSSCLNIYAVGRYGGMVHFNGWDWEIVPRVTTQDLLAIWGFSENDIYAGGGGGTLIHYDGNEWSIVPIDTDKRIRDMWGVDGILYILARPFQSVVHYLYRYDGINLESIEVLWSFGCTFLDKLWGFADGNVFMSGSTEIEYDPKGYFYYIGTIIHYHNNDFDVYHLDEPVQEIWGSSEDNLFVTTGSISSHSGTPYHFDGTNFEIIPSDDNIKWIRGTSADHIIGANAEHTYRYTGSSWIPVCDNDVIDASDPAGALWVTPDSCTAMVGSWGSATACTWYCDPRSTSSSDCIDHRYLWDIWGFGNNDIYILAKDPGRILHYDGTEWVTFATQGGSAIWGLHSNCLYVVGQNMNHFDGANWTQSSFEDVSWFWDVCGSSEDDIYAVGYKNASPDEGVIYHYDGVAWSNLNAGLENHCQCVTIADTNVYVAADETLYKRFNTDWIEVGTFDALISGICSTPEGDVFAITDYHLGHYNGSAWDVQDLSYLLVDRRVNQMRRIWASSPDDIWIAGFSGQILHFDGISWENQPYLGGTLTSIWGSGPCDVYAIGDHGTILHYGDDAVSILITSFQAEETSDGIVLSWEISADELIREFRIHRVDLRSGKLTVLRDASLETPHARTYTDVTAEPDVTYQYTLAAVRSDGTMVLSQPVTVSRGEIPFELYACYPNPFRRSTQIGFSLPSALHVSLSVYDAAGRRIATLVDQTKDAGYNTILWNGRNQYGTPVGSGVYFLRLRAGDRILTRKTILLR